MSTEERTTYLEGRLVAAPVAIQQQYRENLDISWIAHDSALEGSVYSLHELQTALDPQASFVGDSTLQPICEEIRRHRDALNFIREYAVRRKQPINLNVFKKIYLVLHPSEGDETTVKFRRDIPQHRLYFHEYAPPDKIEGKAAAVIEWMNDPETIRTRNGIRIAARAHYDLLRIFPFPVDSGKAARLFMNLILLRSGYPPAIIHAAERQRYYEALKGSSANMTLIVQEAIENSLASIEKLLNSYDSTARYPGR